MEPALPQCVGLAGDGDEIAAIEEVEKAFGVRLNVRDAAGWQTAGDVFASLAKALPQEASTDPTVWERFARALSRETGIDPGTITKDSPLLLPDKGFWGHLREALVVVALMWLAILLVAIAL